jgi:hypothetical protein
MADQSVAEFSGLVSENSALWVKGLKGEELSESDQVAFRSIARALLRRNANIAARVRRLDYGGTPKQRAQVLAFQLYQYPGLRRAFEELFIDWNMRRSAFGQTTEFGFNFEVEKALAELDRSSPPVPEQTYIPF